MRAIEEGLPLVRAANTGISAVVDPFGRVIKSLPLRTEGVLDAPLPQPIAPTPYARVGDGPLGVLMGVAFVLVMRSRRRAPADTVAHIRQAPDAICTMSSTISCKCCIISQPAANTLQLKLSQDRPSMPNARINSKL